MARARRALTLREAAREYPSGINCHVANIDYIIGTNQGIDVTWDQMKKVLTQIAALSKQEQERRLAVVNLIPAAKVAEFARQALIIVRQEVTDPLVWARIQARMTELYGA